MDHILSTINVFFYYTWLDRSWKDKQSVEKCGSYCQFSKRAWYHKIDKKTTTIVRHNVNELVRPRTMCHLIGKLYKIMVTICARSIFRGVLTCISGECAMVELKIMAVIERPWLNVIMRFGGMGHIFDNNFVLYGLVFYIHLPNELYLHWRLPGIRCIDLCGTLQRLAHKHHNQITGMKFLKS